MFTLVFICLKIITPAIYLFAFISNAAQCGTVDLVAVVHKTLFDSGICVQRFKCSHDTTLLLLLGRFLCSLTPEQHAFLPEFPPETSNKGGVLFELFHRSEFPFDL